MLSLLFVVHVPTRGELLVIMQWTPSSLFKFHIIFLEMTDLTWYRLPPYTQLKLEMSRTGHSCIEMSEEVLDSFNMRSNFLQEKYKF